MKQSDIITVVIIAVSGTLAAFFLVNMILGNPNDKTAQVKTIDTVTSELADVDPEVFNVDAINPTIEVYVGECEDVDQNGILDRAELVNCGLAEPEEEESEEGTETEEEEVESGTANTGSSRTSR